jgi:hypothetical protein
MPKVPVGHARSYESVEIVLFDQLIISVLGQCALNQLSEILFSDVQVLTDFFEQYSADLLGPGSVTQSCLYSRRVTVRTKFETYMVCKTLLKSFFTKSILYLSFLECDTIT